MSIARKSAQTLAAHLLVLVQGLVLTPIVIKVAGAETYGGYVIVLTYLGVIAGISSLGVSTSLVSLRLPLMWASRKIRNAASDSEYDALSELRVGRAANRMLRAAMALELAGIRAGLRFPVGGSRLVVARKARSEA